MLPFQVKALVRIREKAKTFSVMRKEFCKILNMEKARYFSDITTAPKSRKLLDPIVDSYCFLCYFYFRPRVPVPSPQSYHQAEQGCQEDLRHARRDWKVSKLVAY